jgi:hypothetical protein
MGSIFSFSVPPRDPRRSRRQAGGAVRQHRRAPQPALRILLVEDSPDNRTIALAYLKDTPYRVDIAENGAIACEKFATGNYGSRIDGSPDCR